MINLSKERKKLITELNNNNHKILRLSQRNNTILKKLSSQLYQPTGTDMERIKKELASGNWKKYRPFNG